MTDDAITTDAITTDADDHADAPATAEIGYADALAELDAILRELEGSDVDVDRLADRVARAADLIAMCRTRISDARLRIDQVIADLDAVADADAPGTTD